MIGERRVRWVLTKDEGLTWMVLEQRMEVVAASHTRGGSSGYLEVKRPQDTVSWGHHLRGC